MNDNINNFVTAIKDNKVVLIKTDTVFGLASVLSMKNYNNLMNIKKRSEVKHFTLAFSSISMLLKYVEVDNKQLSFINKFLPGNVTFILKAKKELIKEYEMFKESIAIRIVDDKFVNDLINELDYPLILTSANISNKSQKNKVSDIRNEFNDSIEIFYSDVESINGIPSTIYSLLEYKIIRNGEKTMDLEKFNEKKKMIVIGTDHRGVELKNAIKEYLVTLNYEVVDVGAYNSTSVDYPDIANLIIEKIKEYKCLGIALCSTGVGISIALNRSKEIRAALVDTVEKTKLTREHNDANVLVLGASFISIDKAKTLIDTFINTPYSFEEKHTRRINKIS